MLNDTVITVQGHVGGDVALRTAGDTVVAHFRLACTPRKFRRSSQEWVDGTTQWFTVNAWRALGENCATSLRRGDAVVVHGRLQAHSYVNKAGVEVTGFEIDALAVGHDLNRGVSRFAKPVAAPAPTTGAEAPVTGPQEGAAPAA